MPKTRLNDALAAVREALDDSEGLALDERSDLMSLRDDIENLLELSTEAEPEQRAVVHRQIGSTAGRWQTTRPRLTRVLGALAETLASLGI